MRRARKAVRAGVRATAITIHRKFKGNIRTVVAGDNGASFSLLKNFELRRRWFANPFDAGAQVWIRRIVDVTHKSVVGERWSVVGVSGKL